MAILKRVTAIVLLFFMGCGTETDTDRLEWDGSWKVMGLEDQTIRYIDASDTYLFAASTEEVYRQPIGENIRIWDGLDFTDLVSTGFGLGDILYTNQQLFVIYHHDDNNNLSPLYRSNDNGQNWENVDLTIEGQETPYSLIRIASPKNKSVLYAHSGYAYRSEDEGNTWFLCK